MERRHQDGGATVSLATLRPRERATSPVPPTLSNVLEAARQSTSRWHVFRKLLSIFVFEAPCYPVYREFVVQAGPDATGLDSQKWLGIPLSSPLRELRVHLVDGGRVDVRLGDSRDLAPSEHGVLMYGQGARVSWPAVRARFLLVRVPEGYLEPASPPHVLVEELCY